MSGKKLLSHADFHMGSEGSCMVPHDFLRNTAVISSISSTTSGLLGSSLPPPPPPPPPRNALFNSSSPPPPPPPPPLMDGHHNNSSLKRSLLTSSSPSSSPASNHSSMSLYPFGSRAQNGGGSGVSDSSSMSPSSSTCTLIGTLDGSVGILFPLDERSYRRLSLLQLVLTHFLESCCALNPRDHRASKVSRKLTAFQPRKKGVLDGNFLWKFTQLEVCQQEEVASLIGSSIDAIYESLQQLDSFMAFM